MCHVNVTDFVSNKTTKGVNTMDFGVSKRFIKRVEHFYTF